MITNELFFPASHDTYVQYTRVYCGHGNNHTNGLYSTLFPPAVTSPTIPLPNIQNETFPMDRNHLGQCTALLNRTECERYWVARIKMLENWLCFSVLLLFLWLLRTFRTFIFTLNVFSIYTVMLTFYFYWSHRSMMNNQCTCHSKIKKTLPVLQWVKFNAKLL